MRARPGCRLSALVALVALVGCGADEQQQPASSDGRLSGTLDGVPLVLEVADDEQERATGLMGRTSVPPGTGMLFRFDGPVDGRFYMFHVSIPLRVVFLRDGRVVSSVIMPPCPLEDPGACPTYGADGPFDSAVETAPEALPDVAAGDTLVLEPPEF